MLGKRRRSVPTEAHEIGQGKTSGSGQDTEWPPFVVAVDMEQLATSPNGQWQVHSDVRRSAVMIYGPYGSYEFDLRNVKRNGQFGPILVNGRRLPIDIGWYRGKQYPSGGFFARWGEDALH